MDVTHRDNASLIKIERAFRTHYCDRSASGDLAGLSDRSLNAELDRVCRRDLHLRLFSDLTEYSDILNCAEFQADDGNRLVGCELSAHQLFFLRELIAFAEQHFHVLLCKMDMSCGHSDGYKETCIIG